MSPDIQIREQGKKAFSLRNASRNDNVTSGSVETLEK